MASALSGTLDRYLFKRCSSALLVILLLAVLLAVFFDLMLNLEEFLSARLHAQQNRWLMMLQLYLFRLPLIINGLLPFALSAAALITLAPMLRHGEWTAVIAGGISPQRIMLPFAALGLLCALVSSANSNLLNPRLFHQIQALEAAFDNKPYSSRIWHVEESGATWYAARALIPRQDPPQFESIFIATADGSIVHAGGLRWDGQDWQLLPPFLRWQAGEQETLEQAQALQLSGPLAIQRSPRELRQDLLTRDAFTGYELWQRGEHMHMTLLFKRLSMAWAPLLALCYALPFFARFHNSGRILSSATQSLLLAGIPVLVLVLSGLAADGSSWSPWISNSFGLLLAGIPAVLLVHRWTP